jgi:hypothetical protein
MTCHSCGTEWHKLGKRLSRRRYQWSQCRKVFADARDDTLNGMYLPVETAGPWRLFQCLATLIQSAYAHRLSSVRISAFAGAFVASPGLRTHSKAGRTTGPPPRAGSRSTISAGPQIAARNARYGLWNCGSLMEHSRTVGGSLIGWAPVLPRPPPRHQP